MKKIYIFLGLGLVNSLALSFFCEAKNRAYYYPFDDLESKAVSFVSKANKSIRISAYNLKSDKMLDALIDRVENGVDVEVLVNDGQTREVQEYLTPLADLGVEIRYSSAINHHKFAIVDDEKLLNSSANFNGSVGAKKFDENTVICEERNTCDNLVNAYVNEFKAIHTNANVKGDASVENPWTKEGLILHEIYEGLALFTSANFLPILSRGKISLRSQYVEGQLGAVESELIRGIRSARSQIQIASTRIRSKDLYDALVSAVSRGVEVQVVLDGQEYFSKWAQKRQDKKLEECFERESEAACYRKGINYSRMLAEAGADLRFKYYMLRWNFQGAPQMHHKYMILDSNRVYSGSYNWSYNAEFQSLENVAIYESDTFFEIVSKYEDNFEQVFNYGQDRGGFESLMERFGTAGEVPQRFEPVSLSVDEIDQLKASINGNTSY